MNQMANRKYAPKNKRTWKPGGNPKKIRRFSEDQIIDIRDLAHMGTTDSYLANKYLTTTSHIQKIIDRKIYKDIK